MSTEPADWLGPVGLLVLACTGALASVALLRRPCRRLFGAENAFLLWGLPPLAMLASQLPHPAAAGPGVLSGAAWVVISASDALPRVQGGGFDWCGALGWAWLLGVAASLVRAGAAQSRYRARLRGAVALPDASLRWPVLRATDVETGPALVGAWRPRIVVPADFAVRYADDEQALILAHEATHARRRDGWWSLLAQVLASLFWFHPLAWWALPALRHDQELACDAAVLRKRCGCRRSYARAMLKTPAALQVLPVGCSWSSRHPLTERIAMLKSPSPGPFRRHLGVFASLALSAALTGVVYAASTPAAGTTPRAVSGDRQYQLDIQLALGRVDAKASHAERINVALCMQPGQTARLETHGIALDAITRPLSDKRVSIDLAVREKADAEPARNHLAGTLRQPLHASGKIPGGSEQYAVEITPQPGCPAAAKGMEAPVTMKVRGAAARQVAGWIATTAGFVLVNPEAIDQRRVTLDFQQVPAMSAMQLVADQDGLRAVFDGRRVRFEPKS
jgi:beta-lactamase regulating signal transducer with metallopeptidase domain